MEYWVRKCEEWTRWTMLYFFILLTLNGKMTYSIAIESYTCKDEWTLLFRQTPNQGVDNSGNSQLINSCVRLFNITPSSWPEASKICRSYKSKLLAFEDTFYSTRFRPSFASLYNFTSKPYWTGLHMYDGLLYWDDVPPRRPLGNPFQSNQFTALLSYDTVGKCVRASFTPDKIQEVQFANCTQELPFYCYSNTINMDMSRNEELCPIGYYSDENLDHCYAFFEGNLTYPEAQKRCHGDGGSLARLQLPDEMSFRTVSEWDEAVGRILHDELGGYKRGWFDRTSRTDPSECNILTQSEVLAGRGVQCSSRFPVYCQAPKRTIEIQPLRLSITFKEPVLPAIGEGSGNSMQIPGYILCQYSRKLEQNEHIKIYKDGEDRFDTTRIPPSDLSYNVSIMNSYGDFSNKASFWRQMSDDIGVYRCTVFHGDVGEIRSASVYTRIDANEVMIFKISVRLTTEHSISPSEAFITNHRFQPFDTLNIDRPLQTWIRVTQSEISRLLSREFQITPAIKKITRNGGALVFAMYITTDSNSWATINNVAMLQSKLLAAAEDSIRLVGKESRRKRQTENNPNDSTGPFVPGSVEIRNSVVCSSQYVQELDRVVNFEPGYVGEDVRSAEDCITDLKPLLTGRCVRNLLRGAYIQDIVVNPKCIFSDLADSPGVESEVTTNLKNLSEAEVDEKNVADVASDLANLTSTENNLTAIDVIYTATSLRNIAKLPTVSEQDLDKVTTTIKNILAVRRSSLSKAQDFGSATNRIVGSFEKIITGTILPRRKFRRVFDNFALSAHTFNSSDDVVVGVQLDQVGYDISVIRNDSLELLGPNATISPDIVDTAIVLPEELVKGGNTRLVLQIYATDDLFITRGKDFRYRSNGKIAAATLLVNGQNVRDLGKYNVKSYFKPFVLADKLVCGYWNYTLNEESGGWATDGCALVTVQDGRYVCQCGHLTNFAILIDVKGQKSPVDPRDKLALSIITIIGLSLSIMGLGLTVLGFILFKQMRKGRGQQTLFNLALAMLASMIVFLVGIEQTQDYMGCLVVAALLHYFILVSFAWMLVEGLLQYLRFVKVLGTYIPNFIVKAAIPAWGVPLIPVIVVLAIDHDMYSGGRLYCWMSAVPFYYAFLIPASVIIFINFVVFILVLKNILVRPKGLQSNQSERKRAIMNLRAAVSIVVILGLTWVFGFLAVEDARLPFQYLFTILNAFQGFFIFILFVARDKAFRNGFQRLCCKPKATEKYIPSSANESDSKATDKLTNSTNISLSDSDAKKRNGKQ